MRLRDVFRIHASPETSDVTMRDLLVSPGFVDTSFECDPSLKFQTSNNKALAERLYKLLLVQNVADCNFSEIAVTPLGHPDNYSIVACVFSCTGDICLYTLTGTLDTKILFWRFVFAHVSLLATETNNVRFFRRVCFTCVTS
jgi:hypothetical protein